MAVYVDEIIKYPTKIPCFKNGSCHLVADTLAELHTFAEKLGLKRAWFQDNRKIPHYDLTPGKSREAIALGAVWDPRLSEYIERRGLTKDAA